MLLNARRVTTLSTPISSSTTSPATISTRDFYPIGIRSQINEVFAFFNGRLQYLVQRECYDSDLRRRPSLEHPPREVAHLRHPYDSKEIHGR